MPMPISLMFSLVELGLKDFGAALVVIGLLVAAAGYAWYVFRCQKKLVRDDAAKQRADAAKDKFDVIHDWQTIADVQDRKIELLEEQLKEGKADHASSERKVNRLTAFNLRLQARELKSQKAICEMQLRLRMPVTDFSDVNDPEDSDFG
jgi:hypothetical protein